MVAAGRPRRLDTVVMVLCLVSPFLIWVLGTNNWHRGIGAWLWFGGMLIGWGFGHVVGQQWALIDELERTRTKLAETAVAEDRQRIARDLHDLVGHSFSVVLLHLSGARMILDLLTRGGRGGAAPGRGRGPRRHGRTAPGPDAHAPGHPHARTRSSPANSTAWSARYRDAGMRVDLEVTGDIDGVAAAPRIVLHDVLREALTNVAKHARSPEATVRIGVDRDRVTCGSRARSVRRSASGQRHGSGRARTPGGRHRRHLRGAAGRRALGGPGRLPRRLAGASA